MHEALKPSSWYRLRYAWFMWRRCGSWPFFAWKFANCFDAADVEDMTPKEAVYLEISYWEE